MLYSNNLDDLVTLIVPAKNRHELTRRLLTSLVETKATWKTILVDDGSLPSLASIADMHPDLNLNLIRCKHSVGPAAARNIGLKEATTPFVAFTDNDVQVTPGWMEALVTHLQTAPPDVAGVGGSVVTTENSFVGEYATRLRLLDPFRYKGRIVYLVTANCIFKRRALIEIGGFDESFRLPGGEDPELSFRLLKAGYSLEEEPDAVVRHAYSPSWFAFAKMFFRYGKGCRRAMERLKR